MGRRCRSRGTGSLRLTISASERRASISRRPARITTMSTRVRAVACDQRVHRVTARQQLAAILDPHLRGQRRRAAGQWLACAAPEVASPHGLKLSAAPQSRCVLLADVCPPLQVPFRGGLGTDRTGRSGATKSGQRMSLQGWQRVLAPFGCSHSVSSDGREPVAIAGARSTWRVIFTTIPAMVKFWSSPVAHLSNAGRQLSEAGAVRSPNLNDSTQSETVVRQANAMDG